MAKATPADPIERLCTRIEQLSEAIRRVLRRCNDNGGEIDAELVRELKAAIGDD